MDEEIDRLVIAVRADTQGFSSDVATMRQQLQGPLATGAEQAGKTIESALERVARTGKLSFEDLRKTAVSAMASIAQSAVSSGLSSLGVSTSGSGLLSGLSSLATSLLGLPGRATGGPVSPGRAYRVGESGPELFVPTTSGTVLPSGSGSAASGRDVRVAITVKSQGASAPTALARSARQVARSVRGALDQ